jgi:hypothetical protein
VGLLQKVKVAVEVAQPTNQIKNKCCAKHGCNKMGSKLCSSCNDESYCSPECQKLDWKIHKIICSKQSGQLLPFEEAMERFSKLVNETFGKSIENRLRILLYLQKFSEYQFEGFMDKPGSSRRTDGGDTSNDMVVDIEILNWIYFQLGTAYQPITKVILSLGCSVLSVAFYYLCGLFFFTYALLAVVYVSHLDDRLFNTPRL